MRTRGLSLGLLLLILSACGDAGDRGRGASGADRTPAAASAGDAASVAVAGAERAARLDLGHTLGPERAPIAVVEFSDFGCPYCGRFARSTFPELRREYVRAGLARWRYVPVVFGFAGGEMMALAAECTADQGGSEAFWRVHDLMYSRQAALRGDDARPRLLDWLAEIGLDRAALDRCMDDPATRARLEAHNRAAQEWYVRGTPTFVVNGVPMSGAAPTEFFRRVFDTVLDPSGL